MEQEPEEVLVTTAWPLETPMQYGLAMTGFAATAIVAVFFLFNLGSMACKIGSVGDGINFIALLHFTVFAVHLSLRLTELALEVAKEEKYRKSTTEAIDKHGGNNGNTARNQGILQSNLEKEEVGGNSERTESKKRRRPKKKKPSAKLVQQLTEQQNALREDEDEMAKLMACNANEDQQSGIGEPWKGPLLILNERLTKPCPETNQMGRCVHANYNAAQIAILHQDVEVAQTLLQENDKYLAATDDGSTVLSLALEEGHTRLVQWLLTTDALDSKQVKNAVAMSDVLGETPVMIAAGKGLVEAVALMSGLGANLKKADVDGNTALMCAARSGNVSCVRQLSRCLGDNFAAELKRANNSGEQTLCIAAAEDSQTMIYYLDMMGARFGSACDDHAGCPDFLCGDETCRNAHVKGNIGQMASKEAKKRSRHCTWCGLKAKRGLMPCAGCNAAYYCDEQCRSRDSENHKPQCT